MADRGHMVCAHARVHDVTVKDARYVYCADCGQLLNGTDA